MMLFSTSHQEAMSGHFLGSRASVRVVVAPEDKNAPASISLYLAFISELTSYGMEYPFGQFGSAVLAVSPPSFLCPSNLLAGRAV